MYLRNEEKMPGKLQYEDFYNNWKDKDFKSKMRINQKTFDFALNEIHDYYVSNKFETISNCF